MANSQIMSLLREKIQGSGLSGGALSGGVLKGSDLEADFAAQLQGDILANKRNQGEHKRQPGRPSPPKIADGKEVEDAKDQLKLAMARQRQARTAATINSIPAGPAKDAYVKKVDHARSLDHSTAAATRRANTAARKQALLNFEQSKNVKLSRDEGDLFLLYEKFKQRDVQRAKANEKAKIKRDAKKAGIEV